MKSHKLFYLSVIVSLVVFLVASFIWLTRATPAVAAGGMSKLKMAGASAGLENISPLQDTPNARSELALPPILPPRRPLLQGTPVITVTKSSVNEDGNPLRPGERITYTIIISNSGSVSATNVVVSDTFPANTNFVPGSIIITPSSAGGTPGTQPVIASGITVTAGSLVTVTYAVTVSSPLADGTEIVNTAVITSSEVATPTTSAVTDTVTTEADLGITKTDSPDPVFAGNTLTYNLTVFNDGPSDAPGVTVVDDLPSDGVTFISAVPGQGSCSGESTITCNVGNIASTGSVTVSIKVNVDPSWSETLTNEAFVMGSVSDPDPNNNSTSPVFTTVQPRTDLAISKTESSDPVALGSQLTYTLNITNNGPSNATGVVVTDDLPAGVDFVSAVASQGNCPGTSPVTCNLGDLPKQGTATVTITVNPLATGTLNNTATVTGNETDSIGGNNSDPEETTVNTKADLAVVNTSSPNPVLSGEDLTYDITVTNNGPSEATGVTLSVDLPGEVSLSIPADPSQGSCSGTDPITCDLLNLVSGNSATVKIIVTVDALTEGTLTSMATVSSSTPDPQGGNNTYPENTIVGEFEKVFLPIIIHPGITELSVHNDNTNGNVIFTVLGTGVSCTVPNNTTRFCGSFPAGTYTVQVIASCGTATTSKTYGPGPVTTRIFCQ